MNSPLSIVHNVMALIDVVDSISSSMSLETEVHGLLDVMGKGKKQI